MRVGVVRVVKKLSFSPANIVRAALADEGKTLDVLMPKSGARIEHIHDGCRRSPYARLLVQKIFQKHRPFRMMFR